MDKKGKTSNKKVSVKKNKVTANHTTKINKRKKIYLGYGTRILLCVLVFVILFSLSVLFFFKTIKIEEGKIVKYQETGTLNYKVYLKDNEFYETPYLEKNMYYIASLIKNINMDFNYQFIIDYSSDMNFTYDIIGKLSIKNGTGQNKLYEKEYVLKSNQTIQTSQKNIHTIKDNLVIDYDYYNAVANRFRSTYGVDATSEFTVYVRINKDVVNENYGVDLKDTKQMSLTIPLTQKTLEIKLNDTGINNSNSIVEEAKVSFNNILFGVLCGVCFVSAVAALLKILELLIILKPKTTKYDKYIKKILNEYDRLIVETPTEPRFIDKEIVKVMRFEELLDARDNLKRPIIYHNLINHQKSYFYIEKENTMYLLTIKSTDIDTKK